MLLVWQVCLTCRVKLQWSAPLCVRCIADGGYCFQRYLMRCGLRDLLDLSTHFTPNNPRPINPRRRIFRHPILRRKRKKSTFSELWLLQLIATARHSAAELLPPKFFFAVRFFFYQLCAALRRDHLRRDIKTFEEKRARIGDYSQNNYPIFAMPLSFLRLLPKLPNLLATTSFKLTTREAYYCSPILRHSSFYHSISTAQFLPPDSCRPSSEAQILAVRFCAICPTPIKA